MELNIQRVTVAKGVAICLMLIHHLFAFKYRIVSGNYYIPMIPFFDFEFYLGHFGKICVASFLFLSGYGLLIRCQGNVSTWKFILAKVFKFYKIYWTYFFLIVPICLFFWGDATLFDSDKLIWDSNVIIFLKNFIGLSSSYNREWWFVRTYLVTIVFFFPIFMWLIKKNSLIFLLLTVALYLISKWFDFRSLVYPLKWQICFSFGMLFAYLNIFKTAFFEKINMFNKMQLLVGIVLLVLLGLCSKFLDYHFRLSFDFILAPVFLYVTICFIEKIKLSKLFVFLGKYSFQVWLVHSFLCYYLFQDIIFWPRYSPFIFMLLLFTSLSLVFVVEHLRIFLLHYFARRRWDLWLET